MNDYIDKIQTFWLDTKIPDQVTDVDFVGLFTNPWFMVPFVLLVCYMIYKQSWKNIIIIGIIIGLWWVSGTDYMQTLVVGEELKLEKVLPVLFGGAAITGIIIYLLLGRSD